MLASVPRSMCGTGQLKHNTAIQACCITHLKLVSVSIQHSRLSSGTNGNLRVYRKILESNLHAGKVNLSPAIICIRIGLQESHWTALALSDIAPKKECAYMLASSLTSASALSACQRIFLDLHPCSAEHQNLCALL